jgi:hypothetical protein
MEQETQFLFKRGSFRKEDQSTEDLQSIYFAQRLWIPDFSFIHRPEYLETLFRVDDETVANVFEHTVVLFYFGQKLAPDGGGRGFEGLVLRESGEECAHSLLFFNDYISSVYKLLIMDNKK